MLFILISAGYFTLAVQAQSDCGLWMGPSIIKEREEDGFGLGMFTGRRIAKGEVLRAEPLFPIFDLNDTDHPPLREYLWTAEAAPIRQIALETLDSVLLFLPGLGSLAPCTESNYNLALTHQIIYNDYKVHRHSHPSAGAFTYYSDGMFTAVRDIEIGEELSVECSDSDFDGDAHKPQPYDPQTMYCLDKFSEEKLSTIPSIGQGLFAKKAIRKGDIILSSPMTPIHRERLDMEIGSRIQLILNYCYGHPESDLLWLPHGSMFNAINHASDPKRVSATVQWHKTKVPLDAQNLTRRQEFHHPELLDMSGDQVADIHGKGLVMDLVATRDIPVGEEIFLDYGLEWAEAWETHLREWEHHIMDQEHSSSEEEYVAARQYSEQHEHDVIRTSREQQKNPYPPNLHTACYFGFDWIDDDEAEEMDDLEVYASWDDQEDHNECLLPCVIIERYKPEEKSKDNDEWLYTAKLVDHHVDNVSIPWHCHIYYKFDYFYNDIPRRGITFVEKPHASDSWLPLAFRHPIGVPDAMYPSQWRKYKKIRRRPRATPEDTSQFKRKAVEDKTEVLNEIRAKTYSARNEEL